MELPELVRSFAERGIEEAGPVPAAVRLRQRCALRFARGEPWRRLAAEQRIGVGDSSFIWLAEQRLGRFPILRVVDAFAAGSGHLEARLLSAIPVARAAGPDADRGELMRYLAELPWAPDAILHNPQLRWRQLDGRMVEVSAVCGATTARRPVRLRLLFADGDVVGAEADGRPRLEGRRAVDRRWVGRFSDYRSLGGRRVPARGEVAWVLDDGPFTYYRGELLRYSLERGAT